MPPPELARDAPGLDVAHPLEVGLVPVLRLEHRASVLHRGDGGAGQGLGVHVPLVGQEGLDHHARAVAEGLGDHLVLDLAQQAQRLDLGDHLLARDVAVQAQVALGDRPRHARPLVHDREERQVVAARHLVVVEVVRPGDLHRARALLGIGVFVRDDGDQPVGDGQAHGPAHELGVTRIARVHGHRAVAQHGLGPGGGDHDLGHAVDRLALQRVGEVPHAPLHLARLDLQVADRGLELRVPVHQPLVAVEQPLPVELDEHAPHRRREPLVQGEALARPVAGRAQPPDLVGDGPARLRLPVPHALHESVAAQLATTGGALGGQAALHHHLGGDARMVGPRHPQHRLAAHAVIAREDVLQGDVERVADVQAARHVGRRDHHAEGLRVRVARQGRLGREGAGRLPGGVKARFGLGGIESLGEHGRATANGKRRGGRPRRFV